MKKIFLVALIVLAVARPASGQVEGGDGLLWMTGGYTQATTSFSGSSDGVMATLGYEKVGWDKGSGGVWVGYGLTTTEESVGSLRLKYALRNIPVYFGGKFWFGSGAVQGFLGAGFGLYFSELETTNVDTNVSGTVSEGGVAFAIPFGISLGLGKSLFITGNYTLNWLVASSFIDNNLLHSLSVGIGFKL